MDCGTMLPQQTKTLQIGLKNKGMWNGGFAVWPTNPYRAQVWVGRRGHSVKDSLPHSLHRMSRSFFSRHLQGISHLNEYVLQTALRSYKKHNFGQCTATTEAEE